MSTFTSLQERGFFYQLTDEDAIRQHLDAGPVTFYVGFDPTADSLHVGHLLPIMAMRLLQQHGHRPIALVGGATAMVGDPSGKSEMRKMLSKDDIAANARTIKGQLGRYLDFGAGGAQLVNNADWLADMNYIDFLRDVGKCFSVNRMLTAESVKLRIETGLSFLEFNYMLLQAYDFAVLCQRHDCTFQFGGQDQWGNIVAGIDLTRRLHSRETFGGTFPLLTDAAGKKFGKTEGGAVWLDAARTSAFDYYQFWRNTADADVQRLLGLFTALPMTEVRALGALTPPALNRAKEILAYEATRLAHGDAAAKECYLAAGGQFGFADPKGHIPTTSPVATIKADTPADLPTVEVPPAEVADGLWICALLVKAELAKSNGEARRLIQGGGCYWNDAKVESVDRNLGPDDFPGGEALLRSGKKKVKRIVLT